MNTSSLANVRFGYPPNGWTDGELAIKWLIDDFDAQSKKAASEPRALFMDGHSSHYTPKLLRYAQENHIFILGYPPHCTHALQGLDVVCFSRMKQAWTEEVQQFEAAHDHGVNKGDFAGIFGAAFDRAFTEQTVLAAFAATGLHPFNPEVITVMQMKPSEPTSVKGTFPLPQPSPVRAVMVTFDNHLPTAFESDSSHMNHESCRNTAPLTSPHHFHDPNIDPSLRTHTSTSTISSLTHHPSASNF